MTDNVLLLGEIITRLRELADEFDMRGTPPKPPIDLDTVVGVQKAFNSLRRENYPRLVEDGVHGPVMTWALKELQATVGLPVTGEANEATIEIIRKSLPA